MSRAVEIAADICRRVEGFRAAPYLCPAGVATIGYGATRYPDGRPVTLADPPISPSQAEQLLVDQLAANYYPGVLRICPPLAAQPAERRAAVLDFAYNLGLGALRVSTLARLIRAQAWPEAATQFGRWVRGGGRILPGLVIRRAIERQLFVGG